MSSLSDSLESKVESLERTEIEVPDEFENEESSVLMSMSDPEQCEGTLLMLERFKLNDDSEKGVGVAFFPKSSTNDIPEKTNS